MMLFNKAETAYLNGTYVSTMTYDGDITISCPRRRGIVVYYIINVTIYLLYPIMSHF